MVGRSCSQADIWQVKLQENDDSSGDSSEGVVINLKDENSINANSKVNLLADEEPAVVAFPNGDSSVLQKIDVDAKFKLEAGSEYLNCGSSL
jgi:hypothetical protein